MKRLEKSGRQKQMTQEGGRCVVNVHLPGGGCGFLPALCPDGSTGEQQGVVRSQHPCFVQVPKRSLWGSTVYCVHSLWYGNAQWMRKIFLIFRDTYLKKTLRKCSPASGVGLRRGVEKSNRMNNVYLPLSCILSASLESWSGSLLCLITPSGVTETSQSEYWSGVAVTANSRMAWTTTSFAVVSLLIMMYRLCWSALKTLSTWSGKSGGKQSHVSVGRISVHGDKIKQPCEKSSQKRWCWTSISPLHQQFFFKDRFSQHTGTLNEHICPR